MNIKLILDDLKKGSEHLESALNNLKEEDSIDNFELEQLNYFLDKVAEPYKFIEKRLELLNKELEG